MARRRAGLVAGLVAALVAASIGVEAPPAAADPTGATVLESTPGGALATSIARGSGVMWAGTTSGKLLNIPTSGGAITAVDLTGVTHPIGDVAVAFDGAVWASVPVENKVVRYDPAGATQMSAAVTGQPTGLDADANDGAVGVARPTAGALAVLEYTGATIAVTPVSLGAGRTPVQLTQDLGSLYATDPSHNAIIHLDGSLQVTSIPLGVSPTSAAPNVSGSQLWFTSLDDVGYLDNLLNPHLIPLPMAGSAATAITLGSDGLMWFAETNLGRLARVHEDGSIEEFAIPGGAIAPVGLAADAESPGGWMWSALAGAGAIARMPVLLVVHTVPTVSHDATIGGRLDQLTDGGWAGSTPRTAADEQQWYRCDAGGGACAPAGEIGKTYTPNDFTSDEGHAFRLKVTGTNAAGESVWWSPPTSPTVCTDTCLQTRFINFLIFLRNALLARGCRQAVVVTKAHLVNFFGRRVRVPATSQLVWKCPAVRRR